MGIKNQEKADIFASHVNKIFKPHPRKINTEDEAFIYYL